MIISGNLDNATPSDEDKGLIETLWQSWETEVIGISHDATDTDLSYSCLLFFLKMVIMKLSSHGSKSMFTLLPILVCVIASWGDYNINSDLTQN